MVPPPQYEIIAMQFCNHRRIMKRLRTFAGLERYIIIICIARYALAEI